MSGVFRRPVNALHSLLKSIFPALVDIGKSLRIHVEERKPAALNLNHDPVAFLETVVHMRQSEAYPGDLTWLKGLRFFIAVPVFTPEDIPAHQHLVSTDLQVPLIDSTLRSRIWESID